ncbi:MAG: hypothetical protein L0387_19665 [Acidobacteria bacterium]|nr:hypothetical protein [Acidobacteriota bacterium]MCI0721817.1 hypothetical protein [Acidobacteriota bacterium]
MRREGRGPRWTRIGRLVRYPERWLIEFVEQNADARKQSASTAGPRVAEAR